MSAPKLCEVCNTHHHAHQAHRFDVEKVVANSVSNVANAAWITPVVDNGNMDNSRTYLYRDAGKRREYMRDLMRGRRASLKNKKNAAGIKSP